MHGSKPSYVLPVFLPRLTLLSVDTRGLTGTIYPLQGRFLYVSPIETQSRTSDPALTQNSIQVGAFPAKAIDKWVAKEDLVAG